MKNRKFPKWGVVIVVAAVFLSLASDWVAPGAGARIAAEWIGDTASQATSHRALFPLWGWLVGLAGRDVAGLGAISVGAGLVCVWLVALMVGAIFGAAVRGAKASGVKGEEGRYAWVESAAVLLAGLAFALTPGFLAAATRVGPLTVALVPGLAALALAVGVVANGAGGVRALSSGTSDSVRLVERLKKGKWRLLLAVVLVGYSAFELVMARRVFKALAFPAVWVWLAVGVMPALVIAWCVRKRWLVGRKGLWGAFVGWAVAVAVMGVTNFTLGKLNEGRVANRIVSRIIANAEAGGKVAVTSDGALDELFFFMLPEKIRLISLARERDPAYGRELSDWVRQEVKVKGEGERRTLSTCASGLEKEDNHLCSPSTFTSSPDLHLVQVEDLAVAAERGPRALIDEWVRIDKTGFEAAVATVADYFPTREKWDEACGELKDMRAGEPVAKYLRRMMGVTGNALGCRLLEEEVKVKGEGEQRRVDSSVRLRPSTSTDAWAIFRRIIDEVEPTNYAAYLNLLGMVQRGYAASKDEVADITKRRQQIEKGLKSWEQILGAARAGGRLYADPDEVAKYEKAKRAAAARRELSPEEKAFAETVAAAPKDPEKGKMAQEAIHRAIREGKVRADKIGGHLITIDLALGDRENAERDAIDVLKLDRHDPTANATLGSLAGARGDYERAEQYLRRAIATGKASIAAKNDLAYSLMKLGRIDEAEPFAREAVRAYGEAWALRETLAAILIRAGKTEEGERELQKAEELAEKAGIPKGKIVSIEIDRARLQKAKGDHQHLKVTMRQLKNRKDLSEEQRKEVEAMDW